jgi:hypothetical protein
MPEGPGQRVSGLVRRCSTCRPSSGKRTEHLEIGLQMILIIYQMVSDGHSDDVL